MLERLCRILTKLHVVAWRITTNCLCLRENSSYAQLRIETKKGERKNKMKPISLSVNAKSGAFVSVAGFVCFCCRFAYCFCQLTHEYCYARQGYRNSRRCKSKTHRTRSDGADQLHGLSCSVRTNLPCTRLGCKVWRLAEYIVHHHEARRNQGHFYAD